MQLTSQTKNSFTQQQQHVNAIVQILIVGECMQLFYQFPLYYVGIFRNCIYMWINGPHSFLQIQVKYFFPFVNVTFKIKC